MKPSDSQPLVDVESDQAKTIEQKGSNKMSQQMPKAKLFTSLEPTNQQQHMNLKTDHRESTDDDLFYSARVSSDREHPNVRQMQIVPTNEGRAQIHEQVVREVADESSMSRVINKQQTGMSQGPNQVQQSSHSSAKPEIISGTPDLNLETQPGSVSKIREIVD